MDLIYLILCFIGLLITSAALAVITGIVYVVGFIGMYVDQAHDWIVKTGDKYKDKIKARRN